MVCHQRFNLRFFHLLPRRVVPEILKKTVEGKWSFWYSISITKPKAELHQAHLALKRDILSESLFYQKVSCAHYLSNGTLGLFVSFMGAVL